MSKWIKTEVRSIIVDAVAPVVGGAGFRYKKSAQAFVRKIDGGRQELGLPLVDYSPTFDFSFALTIRLEAVQAITNRLTGADPKYHSITMTSLTQLEHLGLQGSSGIGVNYRVTSEAELQGLLPGVLSMIRERVLPFFDTYRDVVSVNRGLNPAGAEHDSRVFALHDRRAFDASNQPYRAMSGVTVACLANDPRLPALIGAYRREISTLRPEDVARFDALVDYLNREHPRTNG